MFHLNTTYTEVVLLYYTIIKYSYINNIRSFISFCKIKTLKLDRAAHCCTNLQLSVEKASAYSTALIVIAKITIKDESLR